MTEKKNDAAGQPDVVLDLLAEDAHLREALGKPTDIRVPGGAGGAGVAISVPPAAAWPHIAARLLANGAWDAWARVVLSEDDFAAFQAANLKDYQVARIRAVLEAAAGASAGK